MVQWRIRFTAPGLTLLLCACTVDPLATEGRPCSPSATCGPGTFCDPVSSTCVKGQIDATVPGDVPHPDQTLADLTDLTLTPEATTPDAPLPDSARPPDLPSPDTLMPDTSPPPDTAVVYKPLSAQSLGAALLAAQVPCVDRFGAPQGYSIPIVDSSQVTYVNGSVTLSGAPTATKQWAGNGPSVTVLWDPNACDDEDPFQGDNSWGNAGLLIRGATLNSSGELVLATGTQPGDINTLDVLADGSFEAEFALPDDSQLAAYPQLVNTVNEAKQVLLDTAAN